MIDSYICIDLETTGLNPKIDKIIEIGAVKVKEGKVVDTFSTFINPCRKLEDRIVELTGIQEEWLCDAPKIEEVFPKLLEFLGEEVWLGHSVLFDYSFLKKAAANLRLPFEKNAIDTLKISRRYLSTLEHRNLEFLCEYYEIPHKAHRALEDALATSLLYQKLVEQFYETGNEYFEPKPLIYHVKKDSPASKSQLERLRKLIEKHGVSMDVQIESLTKSEASRFTDKILSMYGR